MLETIETRFGNAIDRLFDTPEARARAPQTAAWPAFLHSTMSRSGFYRPPAGYAERPVVYVRVNAGRWLTDCPFPNCNSAQHASRHDHWFYCARCHNEHVGHVLIPVVWPLEPDAIEQHLLKYRPLPDARNWEPHETLADLKGQDGVG